jgi:ApaG protein
MYRAVTRQIEVTVEPNFLPQHSVAANREFVVDCEVVVAVATPRRLPPG